MRSTSQGGQIPQDAQTLKIRARRRDRIWLRLKGIRILAEPLVSSRNQHESATRRVLPFLKDVSFLPCQCASGKVKELRRVRSSVVPLPPSSGPGPHFGALLSLIGKASGLDDWGTKSLLASWQAICLEACSCESDP